jgi:hypothetical protein
MAKPKRVENWGDIPAETFQKFYDAVEKLRDEIIPRDTEGDSPIDMLIVNRMTHDSISYFPVPRHEIYSYRTHGYLETHPDKEIELRDETERALSINVKMAADDLDQYMRIKYHQHRVVRERARPIDERIKDACKFCAKGVKFNSEHPADFGTRTRAKYPDYPFAYHVGDDDRCKAFELRRYVFNQNHPEYAGKPEVEHFCVNPDCRCKLLGHNSTKGANDKWICANPRCGWDNTKYYAETRAEV